jgi:hypothetical protein
MSTSAHTGQNEKQTHTPVALIAFAWTVVGVPLAYGLVRTIQTASSLFTG